MGIAWKKQFIQLLHNNEIVNTVNPDFVLLQIKAAQGVAGFDANI